MALSSDIVFNSMVKQYVIKTKNNSIASIASISSVNKKIENEKRMFQTMLIQMMGGSENSTMTELITNAISNRNSYSLDDSLNSMNAFKASMRNVTQSLSNYNSNCYNPNGLGLTAAKYESNLNPGAISNTSGDYGGKSYGAWQFSSKTGSLDSFISLLQNKDEEIYKMLTHAKSKDGNKFGENFDSTWTSIALSNKEKFLKLQQDSIKGNYYDVAALDLKEKYGFDISKKSEALKESLLSTVVQHGVAGTLSVFSNLNLKNNDKSIISDLYNERQKVDVYFKDSSQAVKQSVYNRFTREKKDMLNLLNA